MLSIILVMLSIVELELSVTHCWAWAVFVWCLWALSLVCDGMLLWPRGAWCTRLSLTQTRSTPGGHTHRAAVTMQGKLDPSWHSYEQRDVSKNSFWAERLGQEVKQILLNCGIMFINFSLCINTHDVLCEFETILYPKCFFLHPHECF